MLNIRPFLMAAALAGALALPMAAHATPVKDIQAAVAASGEPSVQQASPKKFLAALASVMAGKDCVEVRKYAAAAAKLRPDLAAGITATSIAAVTPPGGKPFGDCVAGIVAAVIKADPDAAATVVAEAIHLAPDARQVIIAAAVGAAPGQSQNIADAAADRNVLSPFGLTLSNVDADAGNVSGGGVGTLNPANINAGGANGAGAAPPPSGTTATSPASP